jgi:hypothetical protein
VANIKHISWVACAAFATALGVASAYADDDFDAIAKDAISKALESTKDVKAPSAPSTHADSAAPLAPLADNKTPAPMPATAEDIEYDAADGSLDFDSASRVADIVAFYRAAMKPLGWVEHRSVINNEKMVVLDFSNAKDKLNITVMRMGDHTKVSATGPGLVSQSAETSASSEAKSGSVCLAWALDWR